MVQANDSEAVASMVAILRRYERLSDAVADFAEAVRLSNEEAIAEGAPKLPLRRQAKLVICAAAGMANELGELDNEAVG